MERKAADGRILNMIGMTIFILAFITDRFIFKIPSSIYIIIMLFVIFLMFSGLWIGKQERDKGK